MIQRYLYLMRRVMRVSKWGNSLAVRLCRAAIDALMRKMGDAMEIADGSGHFAVSGDQRREQALKQLRALRRPLPPGFRSDRTEANER
jgi:antitoxin MazE